MNKEKRIILILPTNKGTIARRAFDLYYFLLKKNVTVFAIILNNNLQPEFHFPNEYVYQNKLKIISFLKLVFQSFWLRKIKKKIEPSISISTLNSCSIVSLLAGGKDLKIGMFRAPIEQYRDLNKKRFTTNFTYRHFFPRLTKLYCVSEGVRQSIKNNYHKIPSWKIETVHNPFDFQKVESLSEEVNEIAFFSTHKIIVCIGRIEKIKGFERLIKAYSLLDDELKNKTKVAFIGEKMPHYFPVIETLINDLRLSENVLFLGHQSNPYKYLKGSSAFVLSSLQEGLPGALIEALILKIPVIATNCSLGVWEAMGVEKNYSASFGEVYKAPSGFITSNLSYADPLQEVTDIKNMVNAMKIVLTNPDHSFEFSCVERFRSEKIIDKFINPL